MIKLIIDINEYNLKESLYLSDSINKGISLVLKQIKI
jgi:hypothetical protein|tara:strand:- start:146 stop:256 length:111 start_codon:yes stop_codon:yes gene_type:complete